MKDLAKKARSDVQTLASEGVKTRVRDIADQVFDKLSDSGDDIDLENLVAALDVTTEAFKEIGTLLDSSAYLRPLWGLQEGEIRNVMDTNADGKISREEFHKFIDDANRESDLRILNEILTMKLFLKCYIVIIYYFLNEQRLS